MHSFDTQDSDTALLGIDSFDSILVLHPCCPQQLQVSFHIAEGLLQSFLPLLQRSPSSSEAPIHVNILLRAEVATRNYQSPKPLLRWEEDGPIRMETRVCVTRQEKMKGQREHDIWTHEERKKGTADKKKQSRKIWKQFITAGLDYITQPEG